MRKFAKFISLIMILVMSALILTACVPSDVDSAKEKMEKAGYFVIYYTDYDEDKGVVGGIIATKIGDGLIALYFNSSKEAKEYAEGWTDSKYDKVEYSGKWAFIGTEDAIEDFKA